MKIGIISDIHDQLDNLQKAINYFDGLNVEKIICLGDVCREETIAKLSQSFQGDILLIRGNADVYDTDNLIAYPNIKDFGEIAEENINGLNIAFFHEPEKIKKIINQMDFIFYGHTHRPWLEQKNKTIIANPGNLAGSGYLATFAILDTNSKKLELKILDKL